MVLIAYKESLAQAYDGIPSIAAQAATPKNVSHGGNSRVARLSGPAAIEGV